METVNIHEAKTHLSRLLAAVETGQEFTIARAGRPLAILSPFKKPGQPPAAKRGLGWLSHLSWRVDPDWKQADDWDDLSAKHKFDSEHNVSG